MKPRRTTSPRLSQAVDAWVAAKLRGQRWGKRSEIRARDDLRRFVGAAGNKAVSRVGAVYMREYLDRLGAMALASQKSRWATVVEFLRWCWRRGWCAGVPSDLVDPDELPWRGARARRLMGRGKVQLSGTDEVLKYLEAANEWPNPDERVATKLPVLTGMSAGEIVHLHVRDVDFTGGWLWVRSEGCIGQGWDPKTAARASAVPMPPELLADLRALVRGYPDQAYLLRPRTNLTRAHKTLWLVERVKQTCKDAGVTVVTTHGLRGTAASLVTAMGMTRTDVGSFLRHAKGDGRTAHDRYMGEPERRASLTLLKPEACGTNYRIAKS
jgi:integrase